MMSVSVIGLICIWVCGAIALENGLARTPPMGWLAWERFRCNTDCTNDPENCISEKLFMKMADLMVSEGYLSAGYNIISLDDCWLSHNRSKSGQLQADPNRFPNGIKALADYVHSRGLYFGMYEDYGTLTCGGYPGILNHLETDAKTFADWGVDYVKLDGCYADPSEMDKGYPDFGALLNQTGRPMVYSCSWPDYQIEKGIQPNYTFIGTVCNLWRNFDDIDDSWASVSSIIDYYGDNQDTLIPAAGPGHWNDPDMLIIGNFGLSYDQSRAQMAMWAILASPLFMSVDLRTIRPEMKAILQNKNVIAVNQDELGIQGKRIFKKSGVEIWVKPVQPSLGNNRSAAIAFLNRRTDGTPTRVSIALSDAGLTSTSGYKVQEMFDGLNLGIYHPDNTLTVVVNPSGVVMVKCTIQKKKSIVSKKKLIGR
ncbi:hypothetical protein GHT06_021464 [Daphnia sinensis]|uniref:Alpha-galactosidase n=1 Tax=Daphnia sinensis TaxID=1820382 RepID=A0AAD5PMX3_9CRUS|nr:hypothetical protein GHT06_021464 [Daphnia sinensis]